MILGTTQTQPSYKGAMKNLLGLSFLTPSYLEVLVDSVTLHKTKTLEWAWVLVSNTISQKREQK